MKRLLLLTILPALAISLNANALTMAYIVNADTVYANLTYNQNWINFFEDQMGYTLAVITDDSAGAITSVDAYDGYFCSATITAANLSNLLTTTKGVVICDQTLYDDFQVAGGVTSEYLLGATWSLNVVDSLHAITQYMSNQITFSFSANNSSWGFTTIPDSAHVLFNPSNRNWDGATGSPDTAFCYALESGVPINSGNAAGRRVVANVMIPLMLASTDAGYCHPYELMGNMCAWAWGDESNAYNTDYNCYAFDRATPPEVQECWCEYGANNNRIYNGARSGYDTEPGVFFLALRNWTDKEMPGMAPDSLVFSYRIPYRGFGTDAPPTLTDTITLGTIVSATRLTYDTTTLDRSYTDLMMCGGGSRAIVVRSGVDADTAQKGDTITIAGGSRNGTNDTIYYARTSAGFFNGTTSTQVRLSLVDPYSGHDNWVKMYEILPATIWNCPLAYLNQGGNPEGSATYTWVNRNFIKSGNTDSVRWSAHDLASGVDHAAAAIDSFQFTGATFPGDGSVTVRFKIPGSYLDDPDFNWLVFKSTTNVSGDSTDIETVPSNIETVRGAYAQTFEVYLSAAASQELAFDDTTLVFSGYVDGSVASQNVTISSTSGVLAVDSIVLVTGTWLSVDPSTGNTSLIVANAINTTGLSAGVYSDTAYVYAGAATNTPLKYSATLTLTEAPPEAPPPSAVLRWGRKQ